MRITYLIWTIVVISFVSCTSQNNTETSLTRFNIEDTNKTSKVRLSDLNVKSIQYVPLETDTNFSMSDINKLVTTDSTLVIFDFNTNFFHFDLNGNFINKIGTIGKGPQEYQFAFDFTIDHEKKQLLIPIMNESSLMIYSLNGKFLKSIPCPKYTRNILHTDEGIICRCDYYGGKYKGKNSIFLIDDKGNIIKRFSDKYKYINTSFTSGFREEFLIYNHHENVYTKEIYSDTVFVFENLKFEPAFILDHWGKTISVEAREKIDNFDSFVEIADQHSKEINMLLWGDYVFSEFSFQGSYYNFFGSFHNKDFNIITKDLIINDIDGGPGILLKTTIAKNTAISWVNAFDLKAHVASDAFKNSTPLFPEKKKELERLANSLDQNDNPVLMLVKLKE